MGRKIWASSVPRINLYSVVKVQLASCRVVKKKEGSVFLTEPSCGIFLTSRNLGQNVLCVHNRSGYNNCHDHNVLAVVHCSLFLLVLVEGLTAVLPSLRFRVSAFQPYEVQNPLLYYRGFPIVCQHHFEENQPNTGISSNSNLVVLVQPSSFDASFTSKAIQRPRNECGLVFQCLPLLYEIIGVNSPLFVTFSLPYLLARYRWAPSTVLKFPIS